MFLSIMLLFLSHFSWLNPKEINFLELTQCKFNVHKHIIAHNLFLGSGYKSKVLAFISEYPKCLLLKGHKQLIHFSVNLQNYTPPPPPSFLCSNFVLIWSSDGARGRPGSEGGPTCKHCLLWGQCSSLQLPVLTLPYAYLLMDTPKRPDGSSTEQML